MIERLAAPGRGLDRDRELLAKRVLADEVRRARRGRSERSSSSSTVRWGLDARRSLISSARARRSQRARYQLLDARPLEARASAPRLRRRVAELDQPVPREHRGSLVPRAAAGAVRRGPSRRRRAPPSRAAPPRSAARCACRFPGTAWKRRTSPARSPPRSSRTARPRGPRAPPSGRSPGRRAASGRDRAPPREKAVERQRVLAHEQIGLDDRLLADGGHGRSVSAETAAR